jgi:lysozyme
MITSIGERGIKLAQYFECAGDPENPKWLKAYLDSGGVWTIGIGTIQYPNGAMVKKGDTITRDQMYDYFRFELKSKVDRVIVLTRDDINQDQFDALVDFAYNEGTNALQKSTLLKTLNNNLTDIQIVDNFFNWRFDNGKEVGGLLRRRMSEALLYFTGRLKFDWVNYKKLSAATKAEVLKEINKGA